MAWHAGPGLEADKEWGVGGMQDYLSKDQQAHLAMPATQGQTQLLMEIRAAKTLTQALHKTSRVLQNHPTILNLIHPGD